MFWSVSSAINQNFWQFCPVLFIRGVICRVPCSVVDRSPPATILLVILYWLGQLNRNKWMDSLLPSLFFKRKLLIFHHEKLCFLDIFVDIHYLRSSLLADFLKIIDWILNCIKSFYYNYYNCIIFFSFILLIWWVYTNCFPNVKLTLHS